MTEAIVFTGGRVLDAEAGVLRDGLDVLVRDGRIAEVAPAIVRARRAGDRPWPARR